MSRINLTKNKAALEKAWTDLHNPSSDNDWVVFGYDGNTFDLKIVESGDGGFEEMVEELNSGKIMYAGCRVNDPNTSLPKIVFVNWQGEGVPTNIKGKCANHLRDVTNMFKGAHVSINARSEDDLDYDTVIDKVKKSSGANYSIHKEKPKPMEKIKPVGTTYKRINPTAEINVEKRDTFWNQQDKDEQKRQEQEKVRAVKEREEEDRKRKEREAREAVVRDEVLRERSRSIDQQRAAQRALEQKRKEEEKKKYETTLKDAQKDDEEFRKRSDSERRRRLQEAQNMIKSRQISMDEEKKRFDQPPVQQKAPPPIVPKKAPRKPVPIPVREPEPVKQDAPEVYERETARELPKEPEPVKQDAPEVYEREIARESPKEPEPEPTRETFHEQPTAQQPEQDNFYETVDDNNIQAEDSTINEPVAELKEPTSAYEQDQDNFYDSVQEDDQRQVQKPGQEGGDLYDTVGEELPSSEPETASTASGIVAKAVYDYQAEGEDEISFDPGDLITNIDCFDEGWWKGKAPNGQFGLFPANYVEVVSETESVQEAPRQEVEHHQESESVSKGLCARALYDYQAEDESEITFDPDDVITNIEQIDEGWWRGTAPNGHDGLFPANYVELI